MLNTAHPGRTLISTKAAMKKVGTESRSTFYRIRANPELNFPQPVYLGTSRPLWDEAEVDDFIDRMAAVRGHKPAAKSTLGHRADHV